MNSKVIGHFYDNTWKQTTFVLQEFKDCQVLENANNIYHNNVFGNFKTLT